jgi:hypothetical protein
MMVSLTGGPRPFAREGFRIEEETNWVRAALLVDTGLARNRGTVYRLGRPSRVRSETFDRAAIRLRSNPGFRRDVLAGTETTGRLRMPLLTLHTTGDGQVPIRQARILRRRVDAAGRGRLLAQRVVRDAGHCGFTGPEQQAAFRALVRWVERGVRPRVRRRFELSPRPGTPEGDRVPGARQRAVLRGRLTLDGEPLDARWLGALVVSRDGLITPCQLTLTTARGGRYKITAMARREASGCGAPGSRIALWAYTGEATLHSRETFRWRPRGRLRANFSFSGATPDGAVRSRTQFAGEVFTRGGRQLPGGTRVEAYVGGIRCGVASVRRTGSFAGFVLYVVGPDSIPGCVRGGAIAFRVNGRPTAESAVNGEDPSGLLDLTVR